MKWLILGLAFVLFAAPFFWLKPGYVDLGGDAGRLYFIDPGAVVNSISTLQTPYGVTLYAMIPYVAFLYILHTIISSPTYLISLDHGIQLSLAFYAMYLVIVELLSSVRSNGSTPLIRLAGLISGIVYVGLTSRSGWITSLVTLNEIFLGPLIFYFLLKYCTSFRFRYALGVLILSILYSGNFGFTGTPQLFAFYPFALIFLYLYIRFVLHNYIPWKRLAILGALFIGLHAFHILPTVGSLLDRGTSLNLYVFSTAAQQNAGVNYFDATYQTVGKLSEMLLGSTIFLIPILAFAGFLRKPTKLLALSGIFFSITFYLVTANVNILGVKLYRKLFYIPGFLMFRSFNEKWYYVFIFFYTMLFALSFFYLLRKKNRVVIWLVGFVIVSGVLIKNAPFLSGSLYKSVLYQSNNVAATYKIDPYLIDALSFTRALPDNGNILTLPLTLPYYQVIYGKTGGAYVGISLVENIGGKKDYSGLWSFGIYQAPLEKALTDGDSKQVLQILSLLGVRYIFRDTDTRIMTDFPKYPYYRFDRTTDIPTIDSQSTYDQFLKPFPLTTKFKKGFFRVQELDNIVVRPIIYAPDIVFATASSALTGSSFRSAYVDADYCKSVQCGVSVNDLPQVRFSRTSPESYSVDIEAGDRTEPFLVIFSEDYHPSWVFEIGGIKQQHIPVNGYANGWIVDPKKLNSSKVTGTIRIGFQKYYSTGLTISIGTGIAFLFTMVVFFVKKYVRKK